MQDQLFNFVSVNSKKAKVVRNRPEEVKENNVTLNFIMLFKLS